MRNRRLLTARTARSALRYGAPLHRGPSNLNLPAGYYVGLSVTSDKTHYITYKSHGKRLKVFQGGKSMDTLGWAREFLKKHSDRQYSTPPPWSFNPRDSPVDLYSVDKKTNEVFKKIMHLDPESQSAIAKSINPKESLDKISVIVRTLSEVT